MSILKSMRKFHFGYVPVESTRFRRNKLLMPRIFFSLLGFGAATSAFPNSDVRASVCSLPIGSVDTLSADEAESNRCTPRGDSFVP